jgi:AcrR family transcriptional regulator
MFSSWRVLCTGRPATMSIHEERRMGRKSSKERAETRSRDTPRRQELLDAATRLFAEKGYAGVGVEDIANELRILPGSLYYWINSKEDLLKECMLRPEISRHVTHLAEILALPLSPAERLRMMMRLQLVSWVTNLNLFLLAITEYHRLEPSDREEYGQYGRRVRDYFIQVIREGAASGDFVCEEKDIPFIAKGLIGCLNWFPRWFRSSGWASSEYVADLWADLVLNGLRPGRAADAVDEAADHENWAAVLGNDNLLLGALLGPDVEGEQGGTSEKIPGELPSGADPAAPEGGDIPASSPDASQIFRFTT